MADTWVTDMRHFLDETGSLGEMPNQALNLVLYFGSIVAWMTSVRDDTMQPTNVTCRRHPKRRRCVGEICASFEDDSSTIAWFCPLCGDNGFIRGWEETLWDRGSRSNKDLNLRKKISENARVPVELTPRERELILEHTFAGDGLLAPVRELPAIGKHAVLYTLYDIEELQGFVAAEANHTNDGRLENALEALYEHLQQEMEKYDDGNWQSAG